MVGMILVIANNWGQSHAICTKHGAVVKASENQNFWTAFLAHHPLRQDWDTDKLALIVPLEPHCFGDVVALICFGCGGSRKE